VEYLYGFFDCEFDVFFMIECFVIFVYYGYLWLIYWFMYRWVNYLNMYVWGYKEEGMIMMFFDMVMLNDMDCFYLVMDVIDCVFMLGEWVVVLC